MILFAKIVAAVLLVGAAGSLLDAFYNAFANWLKTLPDKIRAATPGILIGCKAFVDGAKSWLGGGMERISKNYVKNGEQWQLITAKSTIGMNEVPDEIIQKVNQSSNNVVEITDELAEELKLY